ncbi:hypothetical protein KXD93_22795 [Mucilaginibacter sp. BJC16-A38]|uniref:toxin-antitoxin system YwqK family antitoxin n=1 Tax=Mucilaginibacter phenanthrenivorans TaxID=1234842 RepID=UPI002158467A|nr:hypothetical protein [Mucilaginibacter phenanthrenivorans]MCR8560500.1 hypothetical protein [Mucilaginibacter phenanthrenivorans]
MKFFITLALSILFALSGFCQAGKVYVTSGGKLTADPKHAVAYNLIEKIDDSTYRVRKYNMRDTIIYQGIYKDELMTIPNGRFVYYTKNSIPFNLSGIVRADTSNYISEVGYFSNGNKTGMWVEFEKRNTKRCSYIYKNNKLNGIYTRYHKYFNDYVLEEGNYADDKKEGEWNFYGYDTLKTPLVTRFYKDDKLLKETIHIKLAYFPGDLSKYIRQKFHIPDTIKNWSVETEITVTDKGEIKNPKLIKSSLSSNINSILLTKLVSMPRFIPEIHDGNPKEMRYKFIFSKSENKYSLDDGFGFMLAKEVGNGMSMEYQNGLVAEAISWPSDPDFK